MDKIKELINQLEEKHKELETNRKDLNNDFTTNKYTDDEHYKRYSEYSQKQIKLDDDIDYLKTFTLYELNKAFGNDNINFKHLGVVDTKVEVTIKSGYHFPRHLNYRELLDNPEIIKNVYNCNLFVNCGNNYNDNKEVSWYNVYNHNLVVDCGNNYNDNKEVSWYLIEGQLTCGECREGEIDRIIDEEAETTCCVECGAEADLVLYNAENYCEDCIREKIVEDNIINIE
jgi:hypothetical protein